MRWAVTAAGLVIAANAIVLVPVARDHPVARVTIDVCAAAVIGGRQSQQAPALRLETVTDSLTAGLDAAGLQALGFDATVARALGRTRDSAFWSPRDRPAWLLLRQGQDSLGRFSVVAVAPRRELLAPDSTSFVTRARVGVRYRFATLGDRANASLFASVVEVMPSELHLDRRQIAGLGEASPKASGCRPRGRAVIATGARGGIRVESIQPIAGPK
jgi:hypothetical protein